jgi:adenosine deaminase
MHDGLAYVLEQTDDTLPFRNSLLGEYALLLAKAPLGFGLSPDEVRRIARMSMASRFALPANDT